MCSSLYNNYHILPPLAEYNFFSSFADGDTEAQDFFSATETMHDRPDQNKIEQTWLNGQVSEVDSVPWSSFIYDFK